MKESNNPQTTRKKEKKELLIVFIARTPFRLKRNGSIDWNFDAEKYLGWKQ